MPALGDPPWLAPVTAVLGGRARVQAPLGALTTYRVGGPAAVLVELDGEEDLVVVHRALVAAGGPVPVLAVGQGSNLLVADAGYPGVVVVPGPGMSGVMIPADRRGQSVEVRAGAGARLPVVARRSAAAGLEGLEWAVGIPGSVGGAVRMNAGGHGADMAAVLCRARVFDLVSGTVADRPADGLGLAYRRSALDAAAVVTSADLTARSGVRQRAEAAVAAVVRWRREHQPGGANAGSVFTNPPGDAAGRLVDAAGLKGLRIGSAAVSTKHANFIQADPGGSADDVRRVIDAVRAEVERRLGVVLLPELRQVGFADSPPATVEARP